MGTYTFETWDVFTDRRFSGNQLAVVFGADDLTTEQMQTLAREYNLSETTFVMEPEDEANTARVRIFTPGYEMPFAGHPTVGTALAIARARHIQDTVRLELNAGLFPVTTKLDDPSFFATFENPNLPIESDGAPTPDAIEAALDLPAASVDRAAHKVRRIGAGVDYIFANAPIGVVRAAKLNSAKFEELGLERVVGVLLYAQGGETAEASYHTRMFAPEAGIVEDPATGSAAAAFPGQIARSEVLTDGAHRWVIEQGFEMGRPSIINATVQVQDGNIEKVRIGGHGVPVSSGTITV